MAIVILKNNLASTITIEDLGISLLSAEVYTATDYFDFIDLTESDDLRDYVSAASITVNDGENDLSIDKGLQHLDIESVHEDYIQDEDVIVSADSSVTGAVMGTVTQMTTSFVSTIYESQEYTNKPDVVEWNTSQPTRIQIKSDGVYRVSTCYFVRANTPNFIDSYFRFTVNGVPYGNEANLNTYTAEIQQVLVCYSIPLMAGDYVESQSRTDTGDDIDIMGSRFNAFKLDGVKGDAGPPGGTTITVSKDGSVVTTNTAILNFRGAPVSISNAGGGQANIDITNHTFEPKYFQGYDNTGNININNTIPQLIPFRVQEIRDTDTFNHSTVTNNSRVYILRSGWFEISWNMSYDCDSQKLGVQGALIQNGSTIFDRTRSTANANDKSEGDSMGMSGALVQLSSGDYVELIGFRDGEQNKDAITYANRCWLKMKMIREV